MSARINLQGLSAAEQCIRLLARVGEDLTPLMKQAAGIMGEASERSFANESTPDGRKWPELAESTKNAYVTKGRLVRGKNGAKDRRTGRKTRGAQNILQVSGRLAASVTPGSDRTAAWLGTNVIYAAMQFFGQKPGKSPPIPAREYMGLSSDDMQTIEEAALELIHQRVAKWLPRA